MDDLESVSRIMANVGKNIDTGLDINRVILGDLNKISDDFVADFSRRGFIIGGLQGASALSLVGLASCKTTSPSAHLKADSSSQEDKIKAMISAMTGEYVANEFLKEYKAYIGPQIVALTVSKEIVDKCPRVDKNMNFLNDIDGYLLHPEEGVLKKHLDILAEKISKTLESATGKAVTLSEEQLGNIKIGLMIRCIWVVVQTYLKVVPYRMFALLRGTKSGSFPKESKILSLLSDKLPPQVWTALPAIVTKHKDVVSLLGKHNMMKVDHYKSQMEIATDGYYTGKGAKHFILGTDEGNEYINDAILLRAVFSSTNEHREAFKEFTKKVAQTAVNRELGSIKFDNEGKSNFVYFCRNVAIEVVSKCLGVTCYIESDEISDEMRRGLGIPDLRYNLSAENDGKFYLNKGQDRLQTSKGEKILNDCKVPSYNTMYEWIRDGFRNIFNNLSARPDWRDAGMEATIEMSVYIYELMQWRKKEIAQIYDKYKSSLDDKLIPLDMLGRLLWYQIANQDPARTGLPELLKNHFKGAMGRDVLTSLLKDDRIRSNVFGTVTGAGVNPEEANMRVISSWLNLKEGIIPIKGSASFAGISKYLGRNLKDITLELLRLDPQGEVLLRAPAKDYEFDDDGRNDYSIKFFAGQKVLLAHGSAMFDENVIDDPCSFNMQRASESGASSRKGWSDGDDSRDYEELQSSVYLQHGIGRHICLGRYASEITMQEVLRGFAVFDAKHNLKIDETHRGEILDDDGLYVNSFWLAKK